jgi:hypothetical protein
MSVDGEDRVSSGRGRPAQGLRRIIADGAWYYTLAIATVGLLAWVPFLHAAVRLHDNSLRRRAALYGLFAAIIAVLSGVTPTDPQGNPRGALGAVLSTVVVVVAVPIVAAACVQLRPLRRAVYGLAEPSRVVPPGTDRAVAQALAARTRREDARALAERDPMLARDLNIGRPDRPREYDDGGLVDLNSAPAGVLMSVCGLDSEAAERLVATRELFPTGFSSIDELLVYAELPDGGVLRDRGVLLPR